MEKYRRFSTNLKYVDKQGFFYSKTEARRHNVFDIQQKRTVNLKLYTNTNENFVQIIESSKNEERHFRKKTVFMYPH